MASRMQWKDLVPIVQSSYAVEIKNSGKFKVIIKCETV